MKIFQFRYLIFFLVVLVVPPAVSYFAGFDTKIDYLFFFKAFSIASFLTVLYYLLVKNYQER